MAQHLTAIIDSLNYSWAIWLKAISIRLNLTKFQFDSIRFTIVVSFMAEAIYELWSALLNVLAKLLTVISLGLAVNAQ